jgi:hypothetical protein
MLLFLVCAIVGLDTLGQVSGYGAQTFTWVIVLAVVFLFPYALVMAELGSAFTRAKKRRSQDLMFIANHGLVVSQLNGDVRTDHVLGHGRSVPLRCCPTQALPQSTGMSSPLIGYNRARRGLLRSPRPLEVS